MGRQIDRRLLFSCSSPGIMNEGAPIISFDPKRKTTLVTPQITLAQQGNVKFNCKEHLNNILYIDHSTLLFNTSLLSHSKYIKIVQKFLAENLTKIFQ